MPPETAAYLLALIALWVKQAYDNSKTSKELKPNGGNSLRDQVDKLHLSLGGIRDDLRQHRDETAGENRALHDRITALEGKL